jgi:hypothetical protein
LVFKLKEAYLAWVTSLAHIPKRTRYTLGGRIDEKFLDCAESIHKALYSSPTEKLRELNNSLAKLEILKFLLQLAWESNNIQTVHYAPLLERLNEIGKMIWGWKRGLKNYPNPRYPKNEI